MLERVRVTPPDKVAFTEQRMNRLLKQPMTLGGHLAYPAPGRLEKIIETPFRETLRVEGDAVSIERDGRERRLSLGNRASFRIMLQSIEAIMAGGGAVLEQHFDIRLSGEAEHWSIELTPRSSRLARQLNAMTVTGGARVDRIEFEMPDGEWQRLEMRHDEAVDD